MKPGYKQTEVGVIPEAWAFEPLRSHTLSSAYGPRFSGEHYDERGNVALLRTTDLDDEGNLFLAQMPRAKLPLDQFKSHILLPGDFLVSRSGTCGISTVFPGFEIPVLPGAFLIRLRFNSSVHVGFLKFYFNSEFGKRHLQCLTEGGVQKNIRGSALVELSFPLPSPPEQRAIAEALSDVDVLLGGLDRLIAKKRDLKQAAMQQLLTGQTRLPGFHGEWEVKRLGDVLKVRHGKSQHGITAPDGEFPILASGGEIGRTNTPLYDKPSVLIGRKGTIDSPRYAATPFWTVDTLFFTEIAASADAKFVFYKFTVIPWRRYNEASGVPSLNAKTIENIEVQFPPTKAEQTAIAEVLTDMDAELAALEQRREKTRALKQAMMQELLSGRTRLVSREAAKSAKEVGQ